MTTVVCEKCNGLGEVPTGHLGMWGPVHGICRTCEGTGHALPEYDCEHCMDSGIDDVVHGRPVPCPHCTPPPNPPAIPGLIEVGMFVVDAPTFTDAAQFDRAVGRAYLDGCELLDGDGFMFRVRGSSGTVYVTSRLGCTCEAGLRGVACKHQALVITHTDVYWPREGVARTDAEPCPDCAPVFAETEPDPDEAAYFAHLDRMAELDAHIERTAAAEAAEADEWEVA